MPEDFSSGSNMIPFPKLDAGIGSNAGMNPAALIDSLTHASHSPEEMQKLAIAAATPTAGGHSMSVPLNLQPNQKEFQPAPLIPHRDMVGKGNERGVGIGNAVIGIMNAVTAHHIAQDNKKKLQIATDTQTLLTAQQRVDQNKQLLQNDPQNKDLQGAIEHDTSIINGILSDDKMRKAISKGFSIDFTNPQANNTPDHQAVAQGKQMAQKSASYADQFAKGLPSAPQANLEAQAKYQQAQIDQQSQAATLKAIAPIISQMSRSQSTIDAMNIRANAELYKTAYTSLARASVAQQKFINDKQLLGMRLGGESKNIILRANLQMRNLHDALSMKEQDPVKLMEQGNKSLTDLQRTSGSIQSHITTLEGMLDTAKTDSQRAEYRYQVEALKKQKEQIDNTYEDTKKFFDSQMFKGGQNGGGNSDVIDRIDKLDLEDTDILNDPDSYEQ